MPTIYGLTQSDRAWIETLIQEYVNRRGNTAQRPRVEWDDDGAPECYIAFTSPTGIPALSQSGTTGTGTISGKDDVPGWAMCQVWQLIASTGTLIPLGTMVQRVWNLNTIAIPAGMWVTIIRDKTGNWLVPCPGFQFATCPPIGGGGSAGAFSGTVGSISSPSSTVTGTGPSSGGGFI